MTTPGGSAYVCDMMMDRALGAIGAGSTATTDIHEAVKCQRHTKISANSTRN